MCYAHVHPYVRTYAQSCACTRDCLPLGPPSTMLKTYTCMGTGVEFSRVLVCFHPLLSPCILPCDANFSPLSLEFKRGSNDPVPLNLLVLTSISCAATFNANCSLFKCTLQ